MWRLWISFCSLLWCLQIQRTLCDESAAVSSDLKTQMMQTVVPAYRTAYTRLNEDIVKKLLEADTDSDQATIQTLVKSLLCASKDVHEKLREASTSSEQIRSTVDNQVTQLVLSISTQEEKIRTNQEILEQTTSDIQHAQEQVNLAETVLEGSQRTLNAAIQAAYEAQAAVDRARVKCIGRRKKRFLGFVRKVFDDVFRRPVCSILNHGGINNAKERRGSAEHNLHLSQQRLQTLQNNLAEAKGRHSAAQADLQSTSAQRQVLTSTLNEQQTTLALITTLTKQFKDVEVHLSNVLTSSSILQDEMIRLIDFELVIQPLNKIYHEMLQSSIMQSFDFEISAETSRQISTNLQEITKKMPQMPLVEAAAVDAGGSCVQRISRTLLELRPNIPNLGGTHAFSQAMVRLKNMPAIPNRLPGGPFANSR